MEVPKLLEIADGRPFYRTENGQLQFLGLDGEYRFNCVESPPRKGFAPPVLAMLTTLRVAPRGP